MGIDIYQNDQMCAFYIVGHRPAEKCYPIPRKWTQNKFKIIHLPLPRLLQIYDISFV